MLLNGQYITAELEALVAPGINHSLLSCGSLVRKGWRVEFFDNRMSVSHAGLGGCNIVELCTLFCRNIGWIYSRSLAVDVASANDDFSFAYMVGERQGGETADRSWTVQHGDDESANGQPAVGSGRPDVRSMRSEPAGEEREDLSIACGESVQRRERDAAAGRTVAGAGVVSDEAQDQKDAKAAGDQEDANSEGLTFGDNGKGDKLCTHVHAYTSLKLFCQFYLS